MELWQILVSIALLMMSIGFIMNLINQSKKNLLEKLFKDGEITEKTFKKYLN
jgi:hypothetical protein